MNVPEPHEPPLARYWWLKRLAVASVLAILILALAWFALDRSLAADMQSRLNAYRSAGYPTTIAELQPPAVSEAENAALLYKQAARAIAVGIESPRQSSNEYDEEILPVPEWMALTEKAVTANPTALRLARQAASLPTADWGTQYTSPLINVMPLSLSSQRRLANLLADAAVYEHVRGNDAEAIAHVRNILHQADAQRAEPLVIANLVAIGLEGWALHALGQFAGSIRLADPDDPSASPAGLPRKEVESLIAQLLARRAQASMSRALHIERLSVLERMSTSLASSWIARPIHRADILRDWGRVDEAQRALAEDNLPAAQKHLLQPTPLDDAARSAKLTDPVIQLHVLRFGYSFGQHVKSAMRVDLQSRFVALKLAMRLYFLDHGRYPAALAELTPACLPEAPLDPFAADGRPLGYLLVAQGKRPIAYSVGPDAIDQTASGTPGIPSKYLVGWQSTVGARCDDQYSDLSTWVSGEPRRWKRPALLNAQGADEDPDDADAPGDEPDGEEDAE